MAIIALTYIVDVTVEFQFNAMAKQAYTNQRELTAFLGSFYGLWLNLITFVLQFFLTAFVVSNFGVGGALQIMPVSIAARSIATYFIARCLVDRRGAINRSGYTIFLQQNRHGVAVPAAPARIAEPHQGIYRHLRGPLFPGHRRHPSDFSHRDSESSVRQLIACGFRVYDRLGLSFDPRQERIRSHGPQAIGVTPARSG